MKRTKRKAKMTNRHGKKNCRHEHIIPFGPGEFACAKCGKEL